MTAIQNESIRLLIVDDDEDDFLLTFEYLHEIDRKVFEVTWANSYAQGLAQLNQATFDLCFFDFLLGAKTGLDLLETAIINGITCPIVLLTGKGDQKVVVEAMRLGAVDYLVKSELDAEKLDRCIRYALERVETARRLRENELRLRGIFGQLKEAILLKRPQGFVFYHNDAALDLFGYEETELFQLRSQQLFTLEDQHQMYHRTLQERGLAENMEVWMTRKNGERVLCSLQASRQNDSEGSEYYLMVIQDITARKRLERETILTEKSASTARLVRTLAHEVRNPLTNINLSLDQLEPELEDEELKLFADIIRRNSKRINGLITELLNSFKPQHNLLQQTSIHDLLDATLEDATDRLSLKKITLVKAYGEECWLPLDKPKMKIAFLNFILNAIEAMEEEKGILTISTHVAEQTCYVEIKDNGSGIDPKDLNHLFEPYFTSKTNGLGLGLATAFTILQSHNAKVEVASEIKVGSIFTVQLPKGNN